jgi:serine O-acetyltransferase
MLDHIHVMDEKMERMCKSLKALDAELDDIQLPKLGHLEIDTQSDEAAPEQAAEAAEAAASATTDKSEKP